MIDGRHKVIWFSESKRAMAHQLDLVVHSFEGSIGDPEFGPGQETWEMVFDQPGKFNNRFQPGVSRPPEPLFEVGLGSFFLKGNTLAL